jgi:peptide/nickel transport system substrate-binding protein
MKDNPIGTGPGRVKSFSSQLVTYNMDPKSWWGCRVETDPNVKTSIKDNIFCKGEGVKEVQFIPNGSLGNVESNVTKGKVDLAEALAPGIATKFPEMNKATNHYDFYSTGSVMGVVYNVYSGPFTDVNLRKALRVAVDLKPIQESINTGYSLPNIAGLDTVVYKNYGIEKYRSQPLTQNIDEAKKEIEASNYEITSDGKIKDKKTGEVTALTIHYSIGDTDNAAIIVPMLVDQWNKSLGLIVEPKPTNDQIFNDCENNKISEEEIPTKLCTRYSYQMFWQGGIAGWSDTSPEFAYTNYRASYLDNYNCIDATKSTSGHECRRAWANLGQWNPFDAKLTKKLNALYQLDPFATNRDEIINEAVAEPEQLVIDQAPFIPIITSGVGVIYTTINWSGIPEPDTVSWRPSVETNQSGNIVETVKHVTLS